ncbi:zinc-dependent alcohol dehydrogenase family protein [Microlunatus flavus]|uniref:D-arabinitol dehydrogenase (NADP+) n=1 Tax=Microlunatus flavus TaxID=1036181 RepID=A0A1H9NMU2_9ACTN|nr:zinc-dependent alcohol dehydrogenase family protein [Microlunatus flavus]SER37067.1 D-arabinitol dehydrogenase (NADP+) [Microlunatus flavus]
MSLPPSGRARAVVYDEPRRFTVRDVETPAPGPGQVVLRVLVAGVCGTDLHLHDGEFGPTYPLVPGHEFVGEVVEAGPAAGWGSGQDPADLLGHRVVVDNTASCGRCAECRRARPAFCHHLVAQGVNAPGGFADLVLTDADRCFVVDDLDPEVAVLAEPVACVLHGLDVLALPPGADVLVLGAGPTGLVLTSLLASGGAGRLTVAAPSAAKLALAQARGADEVVRLRRDDPAVGAQALRALAPEGFDVVIEATGAPAVLETTLGLVRTGGTVFVYGVPPEAAVWPVSSYDVFRRELTIKGSFAQQHSFDRALRVLRTGRVDPAGIVTHRFGLDAYADALAAVADSSVVKVVLRP